MITIILAIILLDLVLGFGLAMLFPWLGRRPALAVTYFVVMLVASIGVWIFGGALFR